MSLGAPGFTGSTLDRADHLRLDPVRIAELASSTSARMLALSELDPVLDAQGRLQWLPVEDVAPEELVFLGLDADAPRFARLVRTDPAARAWAIFGILGQMAPEDAASWGAARSLIVWHNRHGFCSNCGAATVPFRAGWGRRCEACSSEHYPRVDPVVIMLAEYGGKVLLARQPQYPPGRYSALAGFIEPGESLEEAVAREFMEEASLPVSNIRYVASQPWPFPSSLMIACIADASTHEIKLDETELEDSMWVTREDVAAALAGDEAACFGAPPHFAIANTLLRHWIDAPVRLAGEAMPA